MRETNFWSLCTNRAAVSITTTLYDRRALDCTADRPLINSLNHLTYLTSTSARIRETLCSDGGLERLVSMLKDCIASNKCGAEESALVGWKWTLALQCLLFLCIRGTEAIRTRLVEAGAIPIICTILDSFLRRAAGPEEHKEHKEHKEQQLPDMWLNGTPAASSQLQVSKPVFDSGILVPRNVDVVWALEILAFVSKYPALKKPLQETHILPCGEGESEHHDEEMTDICDYDQYDFSSNNDIAPEYQLPPVNIFPIVEKFTARKDAGEFPYWSGIIIRNSCRKDDLKGIRQCANFECGKWEDYPRHFAKCRRCKRTKYCSRACQLQAWSFHRYWCSPAASSSASSNGTVSIAEQPADRPQSSGTSLNH